MNGNRRATIRDANADRVNLRAYMPECGETNEYTVTAYWQEGGIVRESPPSNSIPRRGGACPRRVQVTFARMNIYPQTDDYSTTGGPFYGTFWASGIGERRLEFRAGECRAFLWIYTCHSGWHDLSGNIADIFASIRNSGPELTGWNVYAPAVDYVIVELGRNDDLIGARVMDEDAYGRDDTRVNAQQTIRAGEILPVEITLRGPHGWVTVRFEEMGAP